MWSFQCFRLRRPVFNLPLGVEFALDERKLLEQWDDKNATTRYIINFGVTPKILGKLTFCLTATQMWKNLSSLHF